MFGIIYLSLIHISMGTITFDKGFARSSNIAICEPLTNHITPEVYRKYIDKFGFLKSVDIPFVKDVYKRQNRK